MIIKEHTRNQKRMYRIHKQEEKIHNLELLVGSQKQEIDRLNNIINELEKWLEEQENHTTYPSMIFIGSIKCKLKELKENNNETKKEC